MEQIKNNNVNTTDFCFMNTEIMYKLTKALSPKEIVIIMSLSKFVEPTTSILKIKENGEYRDMNLTDMSNELNVDYSRVTRLIKSLIDKGLIYEDKSRGKRYIVNPLIYYKSNEAIKIVDKYFPNADKFKFNSDVIEKKQQKKEKRENKILVGIYSITNKTTNKQYIGQSKNILQRWISHKCTLNNNCHPNYKLQADWNTYGGSNFDFEIIELCDISELDTREYDNIQKYDTVNNGYNLIYKAI